MVFTAQNLQPRVHSSPMSLRRKKFRSLQHLAKFSIFFLFVVFFFVFLFTIMVAVAVPFSPPQHSPTFGHRASSQTWKQRKRKDEESGETNRKAIKHKNNQKNDYSIKLEVPEIVFDHGIIESFGNLRLQPRGKAFSGEEEEEEVKRVGKNMGANESKN